MGWFPQVEDQGRFRASPDVGRSSPRARFGHDDSDLPLDQPAAGDPPASPPQLRRSGTDRFFSGVCGGLAEYTGIDAVLWRVAFVALTVLGGSGILFYALMWVLMPAAPLPAGHEPSPLDRVAGRLHDATIDLGRRLQGR